MPIKINGYWIIKKWVRYKDWVENSGNIMHCTDYNCYYKLRINYL